MLLLATVWRRNVNKDIIGLEITVGKEIKPTSMKKAFLRHMHCNKKATVPMALKMTALVYQNLTAYNSEMISRLGTNLCNLD